jgi:hypothetical protein
LPGIFVTHPQDTCAIFASRMLGFTRGVPASLRQTARYESSRIFHLNIGRPLTPHARTPRRYAARHFMGHPELCEQRFDLCSIRFSSGIARGCKPFAGVGGVSPPLLLLSSGRLRRRRKGGKRVFRGHPEARQGRSAPCTLVFRMVVSKIRDDPCRLFFE